MARGLRLPLGPTYRGSVQSLRPVAWRSRRPLGTALGCTRRIAATLIAELLTLVHSGIRPALEPHLPSGLVARVLQGASRHSPHALVTQLLTEQRIITAVRQWLAAPRDGPLADY